jgi:hypothetical protein
VGYLSAKLRNMAENLDVDLGPSEEDRAALRDAAALLDSPPTWPRLAWWSCVTRTPCARRWAT